MRINLSYFRQHGYRNNSAFRFRLYFLFSCDEGGYVIFRQNNIDLPYLLIELFYIGMPMVRTNGRRRSVYGHVITKFSGMARFTYPWCSAGARFARARAPLLYGKSVFALASVNLRSITYSANQNAIGHFAVHMLQGEPKMPLVNLRSISYSADKNFKSNCSFCSTNFDYLQKKV